MTDIIGIFEILPYVRMTDIIVISEILPYVRMTDIIRISEILPNLIDNRISPFTFKENYESFN